MTVVTSGHRAEDKLEKLKQRISRLRTWEIVPAMEEGAAAVRREPLEEVVADGEVAPHRDRLRRVRAQDSLLCLELPRRRRRRWRGRGTR